MGERRARREGQQAGREKAEAAGKLEEAARGEKSGWYDKKELAAYFSLSVSWVEKRTQEGMPYTRFGSRLRFRPVECEAWLEEHGHMQPEGDHR